MNTATEASPEMLRTQMVDRITSIRTLSPTVETVMRAVPRPAFVPAVPVEEAYDEGAVITKRAADGTHLSCASVPSLAAGMLDALQVRPGDRILEIGACTGYNAALVADLTARQARSPPSTSTRRSPDGEGDQRMGSPADRPADRVRVPC